MGYRLRQIEDGSKFSDAVRLAAIEQAVPLSAIEAALASTGVRAQRERKLNMAVIMLLVVAMGIYTRLSIGESMIKMVRGLRFVWPDPEYTVPRDNALCYRRYQLGAPAVVALFHRVCVPLATPKTPGAFLFGLRLMAIDGTTEAAADTPANAAAFGRHHGDRGASAFPQLQGVYLAECGTHAIVDAGFWPCHTSERVGGLRMLRSLQPGMLVMWDRGFHDFKMVHRAQQRGAQVLSRLPAGARPKQVRRLADGTWLGYLRPAHRRPQGARVLVRIIEYTLTDPALPGYGERHRLLTTLVDPTAYPALDLACAYHERWEVEIVIDEVDTHQRLAGRPLRSLKPVGVIQELYGLLIAHYAIRCLMHAAACEAGLDPDRLSFTHALQVICDAVPEFQMVAPEQLPQLYTRMLRDIASRPLPKRRLRSMPRVVKRKMSNFRLKREEHRSWPHPTLTIREAISLI